MIIAAILLHGRVWLFPYLFRVSVFQSFLGWLQILTHVARFALLVGGVGIFIREYWGAQCTMVATFILLALSAVGGVWGVVQSARMGGDSAGALIASSIVTSAISIGLYLALLYCVRHPDWDTPDEI